MKIIQQLLLRLLYFTPIGYVLTLTSVLKDNENKNFGINIIFPKIQSESMRVEIAPNPTIQKRLSWLVNGVALLIQAFLTLKAHVSDGQLVTYYVLISFVFGVVQILTSVFPRFNWNKKILP